MLGRFSGLSSHDYHSGPGISSSQLKKAVNGLVDFAFARPFSSSAMALGTAVHAAVLEPDTFESNVIVRPAIDRRTKEGKAAYSEFEGEFGARIQSGELTEISPDMLATALRVRDAVMGNPTAANLLNDGVAEESFFWRDEATGLLCKCRPDYLRADGIEVSLKTARNASLGEFSRDSAKYGYDLSTAFYRDGLTACGIAYAPTVHIVVETDDPRPERVATYVMADHYVERGHERYRRALERIAEYQKNPTAWAGYPLEIQTLEAPAWAIGA